jgi:hypothetical protein
MNNEIATAVAARDPATLRSALIGRVIYALADAEDPTAFIANVAGRVPPALSWRGIVFWLDPNDTTTAGDGLTVLRTSDSYVYKAQTVDLRIRSVLSDTVSSPPASPALGDAYLVPAGATGGWSSHQDDIAVFTANGWRFEEPDIGRWLLVESTDGYKRYSAVGWLYGPGARSFSAGSIPLSAALGWGERVIVESVQVLSPPAATKGLRYIIPSGASGVWTGKTNTIAICEVDGTWTYYQPGVGWMAYDKAMARQLTFNGAAWESSVGAWVARKAVITNDGGNNSNVSGGGYTYDPSTPPTTSHAGRRDENTLTYAARAAGAQLKFTYSARITLGGSANNIIAALFIDSNTNAIDWRDFYLGGSGTYEHAFYVTAPDAAEHVYSVRYINAFGGSAAAGPLTRRAFEVQEAAQ